MNKHGTLCWVVIISALVVGTITGSYFSRPRNFGLVSFQSSTPKTVITPYEWTNGDMNPSCLTGQEWCWNDFKHRGKA